MIVVLQIFLLAFLVLFLISYLIQFFNIIFRKNAPYIGTGKKVINKVLNELELDEKAVVYELGCGSAPFLQAVYKRYPKSELIGIEYSLVPFLIAKVRSRLTNNKLQIIKKDMYSFDFNSADLIYCYLNMASMNKLKQRFDTDLRPGTQIISYNFPLTNREAKKVVKIGGKYVYFYKF